MRPDLHDNYSDMSALWRLRSPNRDNYSDMSAVW